MLKLSLVLISVRNSVKKIANGLLLSMLDLLRDEDLMSASCYCVMLAATLGVLSSYNTVPDHQKDENFVVAATLID